MSDSKETKYGISINEAREVLFKSVHTVEKEETIDTSLSLHRVIAEDVISDVNIPHFDVSSKDGYAIRAADTNKTNLNFLITLKETHKNKIESGECRWVETGKRIPQGVDAVVPMEMAKKMDNNISFIKTIQLGENIFKKGVFIKREEIILRKGALIDEGKIGIFPFLEKKEINVYKKPKIGIISIGKNITERNDINCVILKSLIESNSGRVIWIKRVKSSSELVSICRGGKDLDFIVSSGGVSKGREDFVFDTISNVGEVLFHGVRIKPGRPLCFGKINEVPILSLSGNSTPCLITSYIFLVPIIRRMAHLSPETKVKRLKAGTSLNMKKMGKQGVKILPVKIENERVFFSSVPFCFSSIIGIKDAVGLAIIPEGVEEIKKGSTIKILEFNEF